MSEIGLGAWGIGGRTVGTTSYGDTDDATSPLVVAPRARDCGITFFDTSAAYGNGHSEELIGAGIRWLAHVAVVIATKGWIRGSWDRPLARFLAGRAHRVHWKPACAAWRTDYIDLLQLHNAPLDVLMLRPK